mmetsp:Transcript_106954/g.287585  ORF Transcript_106954/g.287585 Transcript_106954/m.287585 type:complete len:221 (+) Transcript_106954:133-795(+)
MFHALVVNGERRHAQQLLLVNLLHRLHGLLVVYLFLALFLVLADLAVLQELLILAVLLGWELLLEILDLVFREHRPDWHPINLHVLTRSGQLRLPNSSLGGKAAAPISAHVREPALELPCVRGVVRCTTWVPEELHRRGREPVLGTLHELVEALPARRVRLLACHRAQGRVVPTLRCRRRERRAAEQSDCGTRSLHCRLVGRCRAEFGAARAQEQPPRLP